MSEKPDANVLPPGAMFGRYKIARVIGAGGMGAVYEATHMDLNKRVALKVVHKELAARPEISARFMREGAATSKIRHPHVVDVTDFGVHDETPYLVMEYLEGEGLSALIERQGATMPVTQIVDIMLPVCAAIATAHDAGVIHRDLKPDNIFLTRTRSGEYHPKVVDFGISKIADPTDNVDLTSTGSMLGTPSYMSPEQLRTSKFADAKADQYALGVILYECATGEKPFTGESLYELMRVIVTGEMKLPRGHRPELPDQFEQIVLKAMSVGPEQRFDTVRGLAKALLPFGSERARFVWETEFIAERDMEYVESANTRVGAATAAAATATVTAPVASTLADSAREIDARPTTKRGGNARLWASAALGLVVAAGGVSWKLTRPASTDAPRVVVAAAVAPAVVPAPSQFTAHVTVVPASASIEVDGARVGVGSFERAFVRDGSSHELRVRADGFQPQIVTFRDTVPPERIILDPVAVAPAPTPPVVAAVAPIAAPAVAPAGHSHHDHGEPVATHHHADPAPHAGHPAANDSSGANGAVILN